MEKNETYALRVLAPLPTGERVFDLFPRGTAEERKESLTTLESLDDLISCLGEEDETALKALLAEDCTGSEDTYEITVGESNYLILVSALDYLISNISEETKEVKLEETEEPKTDLVEVEKSEKKDKLFVISQINTAEKLLGLSCTPKENLADKKYKELKLQAVALFDKVLAKETVEVKPTEEIKTEEVKTEEVKTEEEKIPDTTVSEVKVESPLLVEDTKPNKEADSEADKLKVLRSAAGSLVNSEFRKNFRKSTF